MLDKSSKARLCMQGLLPVFRSRLRDQNLRIVPMFRSFVKSAVSPTVKNLDLAKRPLCIRQPYQILSVRILPEDVSISISNTPILFSSSLLRNISNSFRRPLQRHSNIVQISCRGDASCLPKRILSNGANRSHLTRHIRDVIPGAPILGCFRQAHGCQARTVIFHHWQFEIVVRYAYVKVAGV